MPHPQGICCVIYNLVGILCVPLYGKYSCKHGNISASK